MNKLAYLIDFIDDDSVEVREEIVKQLENYGLELEEDLSKYPGLIDTEKFNLILPVVEENRRKWIKKEWNKWLKSDSDNEKIETALSILSKYHYGIHYKPELSTLIDELAEEFKNLVPYGDELDLANFLFQEKNIKGAVEDYDNPINSNAIFTIKEKRGLPITLSLIYVLVGSRFNYSIKGCNYPGHFLAKIEYDDELIFIDCFNGGQIFYEIDIENLLKETNSDIQKIIKQETPAELIIRRILNNLVKSYSNLNDIINVNFFEELINAMH